jgi:ribosomal protein L40E
MGKDSAVDGLIAFILGVVGVALVLKIIDEVTKEKKYVCPKCGQTLRMSATHCPNCGIALKWA